MCTANIQDATAPFTHSADPYCRSPGSRDGVSPAATVTVGTRERRSPATVLLAATALIVASWAPYRVARYAHRSLVAPETTAGYPQFDGAFSWPTAGSPSAGRPGRSAS